MYIFENLEILKKRPQFNYYHIRGKFISKKGSEKRYLKL